MSKYRWSGGEELKVYYYLRAPQKKRMGEERSTEKGELKEEPAANYGLNRAKDLKVERGVDLRVERGAEKRELRGVDKGNRGGAVVSIIINKYLVIIYEFSGIWIRIISFLCIL